MAAREPRQNNPGAPNPKGEAHPHKSMVGRLSARLRNYLLTGILVTAPIAITFYIAWLGINFVDSRVIPLIPEKYNPETYLPFDILGLGLVIVIIALMLVGWLTASFVGRLFLRTGERVLARMPVIRSIYGALKQVFETVLSHRSTAFREVVLIEYPRRGIWALGFLTGMTEGEVQNLTAEDVLNVFLPTTPNPTSGFLLFLPKEDVLVLDMTVEEGIKMVMSGGIVTPPDPRPAEVQEVPRLSTKTDEELDVLREKKKV
ncbi:MAG: DUF502 domain-containing protein [Alphaproteobacteria bacterium]